MSTPFSLAMRAEIWSKPRLCTYSSNAACSSRSKRSEPSALASIMSMRVLALSAMENQANVAMAIATRANSTSTTVVVSLRRRSVSAGAAAVVAGRLAVGAGRRSPVGRRSSGVMRAIMPHRPRSQRAPGAGCPGLDAGSRRYRDRCPRCSNRYPNDRSGQAPAWQACFADARPSRSCPA